MYLAHTALKHVMQGHFPKWDYCRHCRCFPVFPHYKNYGNSFYLYETHLSPFIFSFSKSY